MDILDLTDELNDFADTAALVIEFDLVITVDTSVAHLAGAMGKPVWILSRFDGCWRWLLDRDDSPWYPTARLFANRPSATGQVSPRASPAPWVTGAPIVAARPDDPVSNVPKKSPPGGR